jgi:hypothetical protein
VENGNNQQQTLINGVENISKMNLQEKVDLAYEEGKNAYYDGKKPEDNPYTGIDQDYEFDAWKEGYYNAAWDD